MIITTNIRLPAETLKALKLLAVHAGTSVSALIRQAVDHLLQGKMPPAAKPSRSGAVKKDSFFDAVGLGSGGPADDSVRHDVYLYGKK